VILDRRKGIVVESINGRRRSAAASAARDIMTDLQKSGWALVHHPPR
jgi:hypothetical protein